MNLFFIFIFFTYPFFFVCFQKNDETKKICKN
jgi:hypothetical protein